MSDIDTIACSGCGKQLHKTTDICPNCGASIRKKGYKSTVVAALRVITIITVLFAFVIIIGIRYINVSLDHHSNLVKVREIIIHAHPIRKEIIDYRLNNNVWPNSNHLELGGSIENPYSIGQNGSIIITFPSGIIHSNDQPQTMILQPSIGANDQISWDCTEGTLATRLRPASCISK